jgi:antitoxin component of RelBE/YafQ-DinJ toxin-antitoxin module
MDNTIINFRTKDWVKAEFMNLCKNDNTNATSVLNQFMRQQLKEAGVMAPTKTSHSSKETVSSDWRQKLVTGTY